MRVDDKPLSVDLSVNIRDPDSEIQGFAIFVLAGGSEDTVPICEVPLGLNLPVACFGVDTSRVRCQKAFPVLSIRRSTDILARRKGVKNEQTLTRRVVRHDAVNIFGIHRRY